MDCSHPESITALDAVDALAYSCNSYFAALGSHATGAELRDAFQRAGLFSATGLAPDEAVGRIWTANDESKLELQALGHWGIEVTPLELLAAYRSLALQKLRHQESDKGNGKPSATVSEAVASERPVFEGLERSVQYGMAHLAQPVGITAAGKTGTASGPNTHRTHGFFAGYAPAAKPEIVLVVYLESGRGADAAALAAPIFTAYGKESHANVGH